jgi:hypothetical protein
MGKYEPLTQHLASLESDSWDASFPEIEKVLGFELPFSAYNYPAWWSNQEKGHSQTRGWRDAGWETCNLDLSDKRVRFLKFGEKGMSATHGKTRVGGQNKLDPETEKLLAAAHELTGIADRNELIAFALRQLVHTEAAKGLAALGGSDRQAKAPERRRFW